MFFYVTYLTKYCDTLKAKTTFIARWRKLGRRQNTEYKECTGFISSRRNWFPPPLTRKRVLTLRSFGSKGETHSLAREGVGIGEQTVWISRYMYYKIRLRGKVYIASLKYGLVTTNIILVFETCQWRQFDSTMFKTNKYEYLQYSSFVHIHQDVCGLFLDVSSFA